MAADDLLPSYQFAAVKQRTSPELRKQIQYELILRQQPKQSRMCGVGEKADRRPIDPPPIVQLIVRAPGPKGEYTPYLQNPYYFMHASLVEKDTKEEVHLIKDNKTKATTGSSVSSLYPLKDTDGSSTDSGFFVFPDLSVRMEGTYRLKFCLYEMVGREVYFCSSVISAPLTVYSAKKFPGMEESTALSQSFAEQGLKIRIRKEIRPKKKRRGIHPTIPPSLAIKEEGTSDFQQDSDDNDRDRTSPPLATDGQKAKRRYKSMEREGRNEVAKKSTAQAPKRITYPSTPSQSSTMEVDSSASSVASHPDSSTHATEITRRSSGSSVGHPFAEYRHPESEAETHHSSPGTARRVSADLHGPVNHSMLPPGQPPMNYHYSDYSPHRPSQSHPYTAVQHHSAVDTRAPITSTQGASYSYYSAPRISTVEATQATHDSRRRSESSHSVPPSFEPRPESYPSEYNTGYSGSHRSTDSAPIATHEQVQGRRGSSEQRHPSVTQHTVRQESSHDGAPPTYGRQYPTHPPGNSSPVRSSHDRPEVGDTIESRPQHYPPQHSSQSVRHYGYSTSGSSTQEASYSQVPVHHHHHHHHYHVMSPYDAPRLPGSYTEVIVNGPTQPPYGPSYTSDTPSSRVPGHGAQEPLPTVATNNSPGGNRGGHEAMALVPVGHTKSGLSPVDERVNSPSDYFGHRPSNGHEGAHRHTGYYYQYGMEGTPPVDPSVPPHHRRALSASAASGPADPPVGFPRDIPAAFGDRSNRPGPPPHRHSSQAIPVGGAPHFPPSSVTSPSVHPLSTPKSATNSHSSAEYGHSSPTGHLPSRPGTAIPLPHGNDASYSSQPWTHAGYKPLANGEWSRSNQPPLAPPSSAPPHPPSHPSSHPPVSSIAHAGISGPVEHHSSYAYPSNRRSVSHNHHTSYHPAHSSNSSRPGLLLASTPNNSSVTRQSHPPPPPPPRGYDSSYTSSPRYPISDPPHSIPPPASSWYESSHNAGPVPAIGGVGGTSSEDSHPSLLEMRDSRSSGPHVLGQPATARAVESCADMPRGYPSRRNS